MIANADIQFITVKPADLKALCFMSRKTFIDAFAHLNNKADMDAFLADNLTEEKLAYEIQNLDSQFYFAVTDNEPVGYIKINTGPAQTELQEEQALEIERIYVLQDYQGKKIGRFMFNNALQLAKKANKKYIWLGVWSENNRAIKFYQELGFAAFDSHPFKLGNDIQTDIMMKLELS